MSLHLSVPEVVVHPSANEIKKALARTARSLVESAKSFKRWMDGTCIDTPDLPGVPQCLLAVRQCYDTGYVTLVQKKSHMCCSLIFFKACSTVHECPVPCTNYKPHL